MADEQSDSERRKQEVLNKAYKDLKEAHEASGSEEPFSEVLSRSLFLDSFKKGMRRKKYDYDQARLNVESPNRRSQKFNPKTIEKIEALEKRIHGQASGGSVKGRPAKRSAEKS